MIRCQKCDMELTSEYGTMPRVPCPKCGSTTRAFSISVGGGKISLVGGNVSLIHTRPGLQSEARRDDQGNIVLTAIGPSPRNEDDVLEICARLVRRLNLEGGTWSIPIKGEQDIDAMSEDSSLATLRVQVVRASSDQKLWRAIGRDGSTSQNYCDNELATEMMDAIRKKSRYPAEQKIGLHLVLDAARTPSHTFQAVLDAFREEHLLECRQAGFAQIWIVGPQDSLVSRLDV